MSIQGSHTMLTILSPAAWASAAAPCHEQGRGSPTAAVATADVLWLLRVVCTSIAYVVISEGVVHSPWTPKARTNRSPSESAGSRRREQEVLLFLGLLVILEQKYF